MISQLRLVRHSLENHNKSDQVMKPGLFQTGTASLGINQENGKLENVYKSDII